MRTRTPVDPASDPGHRHALDLLGAALDYTCGSLRVVEEADLGATTPCREWRLGDLLAHMDDALDAFAEAAAGDVAVHGAVPLDVRVESLQVKTGHLHRTWRRAAGGTSQVGGLEVDTTVLVLAAALEIAVHGWDVAQALGRRTPLPQGLAVGLLPAAVGLVGEADRGTRFADPVSAPADAGAPELLLGHLGREVIGV